MITSADVVKLYPSLDSAVTAKKCGELVGSHEDILEDLDIEQAAKYLALTADNESIENWGLDEVVHSRKNEGGTAPGITTAEVMGPFKKEEVDESKTKLKKPERLPTPEERKRIIVKCVTIAVQACLDAHMYCFNNIFMKQRKGLGIGLKLAQAAARLYMLHWDMVYLNTLEKGGVVVDQYGRYVDDSEQITAVLPVGARWDNTLKKVVIREECIKEDEGISEDIRTGNILNEVANSIDNMIKVTQDSPSMNNSGMLPILDVQVKIVKGYNAEDRVSYSFYRKKMSTNFLILCDSAMPAKTKRQTLTMEALRILRNCSKDVVEEEVHSYLTEFAARMKKSGYGEGLRKSILEAAMRIFKVEVQREEEGTRPIHRWRYWKEEERYDEKKKKASNWFAKGGFESVLFVPTTENGELERRLRNAEERKKGGRKWRLRIQETTGRTLKTILHNTQPWEEGVCQDKEGCLVCKHAVRPGGCRRVGAAYSLMCLGCKEGKVVSEYVGETGRSPYTRGQEHLRLFLGRSQKSVLWRHCLTLHSGDIQKFKMEVRARTTTALERQAMEGVMIKNFEGQHLMNTKAEWRGPKITRTSFNMDFLPE